MSSIFDNFNYLPTSIVSFSRISICFNDCLFYLYDDFISIVNGILADVQLSRSSRCPANQPTTGLPTTGSGLASTPTPPVTPWPQPSSTSGLDDATISKDILDHIFTREPDDDTSSLIDVRQNSDD